MATGKIVLIVFGLALLVAFMAGTCALAVPVKVNEDLKVGPNGVAAGVGASAGGTTGLDVSAGVGVGGK